MEIDRHTVLQLLRDLRPGRSWPNAGSVELYPPLLGRHVARRRYHVLGAIQADPPTSANRKASASTGCFIRRITDRSEKLHQQSQPRLVGRRNELSDRTSARNSSHQRRFYHRIHCAAPGRPEVGARACTSTARQYCPVGDKTWRFGIAACYPAARRQGPGGCGGPFSYSGWSCRYARSTERQTVLHSVNPRQRVQYCRTQLISSCAIAV